MNDNFDVVKLISSDNSNAFKVIKPGEEYTCELTGETEPPNTLAFHMEQIGNNDRSMVISNIDMALRAIKRLKAEPLEPSLFNGFRIDKVGQWYDNNECAVCGSQFKCTQYAVTTDYLSEKESPVWIHQHCLDQFLEALGDARKIIRNYK